MIIKREINGETVTIELTSEELRLAYDEKEHEYDVEDVQNFIDEEYELEMVHLLESYEDDIAYEKRRLMEEFGYSWHDAVREAVRTFVRKIQEG